jgi:hypothetical protein
LTFTQSRDSPERYAALGRFDTMPSRPIAQACRNTSSPPASVCSFNSIPGGARPSSLSEARLALAERLEPIVDPVELKQVERLQDGVADRAVAVEGVEDSDPVTRGPNRVRHTTAISVTRCISASTSGGSLSPGPGAAPRSSG